MHIFEFHTGLKPETRGEQSVMTCPFCLKEDHFFYNNSTFLWDCKVCGRTGNPATFMQELYGMFDNITKTSQEIVQLRGLTVQAVHDCKLKYNPMNGTYQHQLHFSLEQYLQGQSKYHQMDSQILYTLLCTKKVQYNWHYLYLCKLELVSPLYL